VNTVHSGHFCQLILSDPFPKPDGFDSVPYRDLDVLQYIRLWAYAAFRHPA
jgi:hypothetical protein